MSAHAGLNGGGAGAGFNTRLVVTFFDGYAAASKHEETYTLAALASCIKAVTAGEKKRLPWLKFARFGNISTDANSLRHDANMLAISGIEADYDEELMALDEAVEILTKAGVEAIVYTSPSHTEAAPRWRVLCPFSTEYPPDRRGDFMGRLNGLFRGVFSAESWTLSQSYYFGSVKSNPAHRVELIDGIPIDELDELDEIWLGKPGTKPGNGANSSGGEHYSGPLDQAALLADLVSGKNYHTAAVRLLGKWARDGMPYLDARKRLIDAFDGVFPPDRDARWKARHADIDRCLEGIYGKEAAAKDEGRREGAKATDTPGAAPPSTFIIINPTTLSDRLIPKREWIVQDWLPVGAVTANFGDGGTGKTLLAQQLMTACATKTPWCGLAVEPCRSLALFCEDDADELHRRQDQINQALGMTFGDLGAMQWSSGVGQDNALVSFAGEGRMILMPKFGQIRDAAIASQARLIVLDTAADLFAGNENDRHQVRQFLSQLSGLAVEIKGAILLTAHPSRTGMSSGNLDGGSTAWNNSVRSRWSLARPAADDAQPDTNERVLTRRKANYATIGDTILLHWVSGVLAPVIQASGVFGSISRQAAEQVFLTLLDRCWAQGVFVSHSRNASNFAPKVFAKRPERDGYNRNDFDLAMNRLLGANEIRVENYCATGRNKAQRIARRMAPTTPNQNESGAV